MAKDIIDFSKQDYWSAQEFKEAVKDLALLILRMIRLSEDTDLAAIEIANKCYVLEWLLNDVEYIDRHKPQSNQ